MNPEFLEWIYVLKATRLGMLKEGPTDAEAQCVGRHFHYLKDLTEQGVMILVGRSLNDDEHTIGIAVFRAGTEDAAREIMQNDPAVKEGVMSAELMPFKVALRGQ